MGRSWAKTAAIVLWCTGVGAACPSRAQAPPTAPVRPATPSAAVVARLQAIDAAIKANRAAAVADEADKLAAELDASEPPASEVRYFAHRLVIQVAMQTGDTARMERHVRAALAGADAGCTADPGANLWLLGQAGQLAALREDYARAEADFTRAWQLSDSYGLGADARVQLLQMLFAAGIRHRTDPAWALPWLDLRRQWLAKWPAAPWQVAMQLALDEGSVAMLAGNLAKAQEHAERAVAVAQAGHKQAADAAKAGEAHLLLGTILASRGQYAQAEVVLRRAVALGEAAGGMRRVTYLQELASVLRRLGRLDDAVKMVEEAMQGVPERARGSSAYAGLLNTLSELRGEQERYGEAIALRRKALALLTKLFGPDHLQVAAAQGELAYMLIENREYPEAAQLLHGELAVYERKVGADNPALDTVLTRLCNVERLRGQPAAAKPFCERGLQLVEKAWGPLDVRVSGLRENLAMVELDLGHAKEALAQSRAALRVRDAELARLMLTGSEDDRFHMLGGAMSEVTTRLAMALDTWPNLPEAADLAEEAVLQRKGRLFDAVADQTRAVRALGADGQQVLADLDALRQRMASLAMAGRPVDPALERQRQDLERQLVQLVAQRTPQMAGISLAQIQAALPERAVLVEYSYWQPWQRPPQGGKGSFVHSDFGPVRLSAALVRRTGHVQWLDLGPAQPVLDTAAEWRARLMDPRRSDVDVWGRKLDGLIFEPIRKRVDAAELMLIAPDGPLHVVPFAALVDADGKYAVETRKLARLTAGRDLLRIMAPQGPGSAPIILANPAFDGATGGQTQVAGGRRSADAGSLHFADLPGALAEGKAIAAAWPGSQLKTGADVTEAALRAVRSPQVLHIATHGFFLPPSKAGQGAENPLLRSGLALAGCNAHPGSGDDGLLTALEAGQLDLAGTRMVILSACETGLGQTRSGDGVQGLQRAFAAAGARTVVMSLWKVDDAATEALMVAYYQQLRSGAARGTALQSAQLAVAQPQAGPSGTGPGRSAEALGTDGAAPAESAPRRLRHPFYWASFQAVGDWRPL